MFTNIGVYDRGEELYTREELYDDEANGYDYEITMSMLCHNASRDPVVSGVARYDVYKDIIRVGNNAASLGRYKQQKELFSLIESWVLPAETWDALVFESLNGSSIRASITKAGARAGSAECILVEWAMAGSIKDFLERTGSKVAALPERETGRVKALLRGEDLEVRKAVGGLLGAWTGTLEELIHASRESIKLGREAVTSGGGPSSVIENPGQTSSEFGAGREKTLGPGF